MNDPLILASASPRRADLLRTIGCRFDVVPSQVDEDTEPGLSPGEVVATLAARKAADVAAGYPDRVTIGADTVVAVDGTVLGKPRDRTDAAAILRALSGRTHAVLTAVTLLWPARSREENVLERTEVRFRDLSDADVTRYLDTDEPWDKAGAYGIQGRASVFVERVDGCFYNVVGFPLTAFWLALGRITDGDPWACCHGDDTPDLLSSTK